MSKIVDGSLNLILDFTTTLKDIPAQDWDACANPYAAIASDTVTLPPDGERDNPFLSHAFLRALETSGSVGGKTGWAPFYCLVRDEADTLLGATPSYLKAHSMGEYVFDHSWAQAFQRAGGNYYPKLQVAVPFTPVTGRRLLVRAGGQETRVRAALLTGLAKAMADTKASSINFTFPDSIDAAHLESAGYLHRIGEQFHFHNQNFTTFDDFLATLASRKRKAIKRERKIALEAGLTVEQLTGADLTKAHFDAFFEFYIDTGARKWGHPYLNRAFFSHLRETMADRVLLILAKRGGRYIAGALNMIGRDALYGRYWGAIEHYDCLHFELCYYQAIDYAIKHRLARVEAGAQGEHKLARGYQAVKTHSAHSFASPALARAVGAFLEQEREFVEDTLETYARLVPFKKG